MTEVREFVCLACPMSCPLRLEQKGGKIVEITGQTCDRGAKYAEREFTDPRRPLSTTIAIGGGEVRRLPVKTTYPIPKDKMFEAAKEIRRLKVSAPVSMGQKLITGLLGEKDVDVIACRSVRSQG